MPNHVHIVINIRRGTLPRAQNTDGPRAQTPMGHMPKTPMGHVPKTPMGMKPNGARGNVPLRKSGVMAMAWD